MASWLRNDLHQFACDVLLDPLTTSRGYFRSDEVGRLLRRHAEGTADHANQIWALLVQELWHREFIDGVSTTPTTVALATA